MLSSTQLHVGTFHMSLLQRHHVQRLSALANLFVMGQRFGRRHCVSPVSYNHLASLRPRTFRSGWLSGTLVISTPRPIGPVPQYAQDRVQQCMCTARGAGCGNHVPFSMLFPYLSLTSGVRRTCTLIRCKGRASKSTFE